MNMNLNNNQILAFVLISPFLLLLVAGLSNPENISTSILKFSIFFLSLYFFIRFLWVLGCSYEDEIHFKESVLENVNNNICPLCGKEKISDSNLTIGYRKRIWSDFEYKVYYIKYSTDIIEITTKVQICKSCGKNYLSVCEQDLFAIFHVNPSIKLLKRKLGYLRGIKFPFEKWNISISKTL
ncbi:MAG: hypothetical protein IPJ03_19390 [Ignavibacteriales bacterium]|nr:hypothetical protein [Ignavibacteriales bacterium]MBK7381121.1 hypothetical protein [Ignavibacteriales bacterium]